MKKLLLILFALAAFAGNVYATDVTVSASTISAIPFNPTSVGSDRSITVTVTNGSATVTSAALFPPEIVGVYGFKVALNGTVYTVSTVTSRSSLTLTTNFTGFTGSLTMTLYRYALFRVYNVSSFSFLPLNSSDLVLPGAVGTGFFYRQIATSIINDGARNVLYIPEFIIPATTDALLNNQARYSFVFFRPDGSLLDYYRCGSTTQFAIPPITPTTFPGICNYNAVPAIVPPNTDAYSKTQIDQRFPSCMAGQLLGFTQTGNVAACVSSSASLTVKEVDASPTVTNVSVIRVSNGTLTDDGSGQVTIAIPSLTVRDEDGSPNVNNVNTIRVTNGTLTNNGGGDVSLAFPNNCPGTASSGQVTYNNAGTCAGITNATAVAGGSTLQVTSGRFVTALNDTNGNELFVPVAAASAVTYVEVGNGATGVAPYLKGAGESNTDLTLDASGTGVIKFLQASLTVPVTLSDAATIATDSSLSNRFRVTLGGNRTLGNPTNARDGQQFVWEILQDATGSRTLAFDTKFAFGAEITACTINSTANKRNFITAIYNSSADKFYIVGCVTGY